MPDNYSEQERLRRLRDGQLKDRDPHTKQRAFYRASYQREQRLRKPLSFKEEWAKIPHSWKIPFFGLILGMVGLVAITSLWISRWALPCGLVATLIFVVVGFSIGKALDLRDELKDLAR